jgi:hypothetical protein
VPTGPHATRLVAAPRGYSHRVLATTAATLLTALTPVVIHDSAERFPLTSAAHYAPASRSADATPAAYGHAVPASSGGGVWLQYWLFYAYQDQDRGIVGTGRHAADWETVQYHVSPSGRLLEAVYAQHSGAERCSAASVSFSAGHPIVYAAHGSHASYFRPGTRDRTWPDPNDEADGHGPRISPRLVPITRTSPPWMTHPAPWGHSRASSLIPGEQDSPRGPFFQPSRWNPNTLAASAHGCRASCDHVGECDTREKTLSGALIALPLALVALFLRRRYGRP